MSNEAIFCNNLHTVSSVSSTDNTAKASIGHLYEGQHCSNKIKKIEASKIII